MESELNGAMWFLRALLIMVILYIFMDFFAMKIRNTTVRNIVLAIVVVLMLVIGKNRILPGVYNLNRIFESMQFFFLGVLIKEYKLDELISKYKVPVFAVGIIIMGITSVFFYGALGVDEGYKDILGNLCGIVGLFALSMFKPVQESKLLALLGKASLDIMSLHFLAFKVVSYALIVIYGMNIERLSELPVLKGTHGIAVILYLVVGLGLCTIEYLIRNKICIKMKENK